MERSAEGREARRPLALVVNADPAVRARIRGALERRSFEILEAANEDEARKALDHREVRLLLMDGSTGGGLVEQAPSLSPAVLVLASDPGDTRRALQLAESGVFDLLPSPLSDDGVDLVLARARRQIERMDDLRSGALRAEEEDLVVGRSTATERLRSELARLAHVEGSIWIQGEPGSGRQLAARRMHAMSPRREAPFVTINCRALAGGPRESIWTATRILGGPNPGSPDQPARGTLYLEGVTDLPTASQEGLLRALDQGLMRNVKVMASSTRSPEQAVENGVLLETLAPRLSQSTLTVPRLRDRTEDIEPLARHFASRICRWNRLPLLELAPDAVQTIESYGWPGNVFELREAVEHAALLAIDGTIRAADLPAAVRGSAPPTGASASGLSLRRFRDAKRAVVESFEAAYLRDLLERHAGNVTAASQQAGMLRSALQRLLRKHGLRSQEFRRAARARAARAEEPGPGADKSS